MFSRFVFALPLLSSAEPFPASTGGWQWVDVVGTKCMSGKETGVYVRYSKSGNKNLGIYLYGGGACFNDLTCAIATTDPHPGDMGSSGIFAARSDNPLNDYNWITVPYCTGDVHSGNAVNSKHGNFNGLPNLKLILERAVETFFGVESLFVTGESAGGFGSIAAYPTIRSAFPDARGVVMDDSGPIVDDDDLAPCLQQEWRQMWNLNDGLPSDCPCNNDKGNLVSAWAYAKSKWPQDSFSLVSSVADSTISTFFAFGNNNCNALLPIGYSKLQAGLENLADSGIPVYMIPGSVHTHTSNDEFYSRSVSDMNLNSWVAQLLDPNQPDPSPARPTAEDYVAEMMVPTNNTMRVIV